LTHTDKINLLICFPEYSCNFYLNIAVIQLIKAQVGRTTVEITVLLLTNHVTQPNYCIVLTRPIRYSIYSNEIVYWLNQCFPTSGSRPIGGSRSYFRWVAKHF